MAVNPKFTDRDIAPRSVSATRTMILSLIKQHRMLCTDTMNTCAGENGRETDFSSND